MRLTQHAAIHLVTFLVLSVAMVVAQNVDRELSGKVMTGYQGWFRAEGDGSD